MMKPQGDCLGRDALLYGQKTMLRIDLEIREACVYARRESC